MRLTLVTYHTQNMQRDPSHHQLVDYGMVDIPVVQQLIPFLSLQFQAQVMQQILVMPQIVTVVVQDYQMRQED